MKGLPPGYRVVRGLMRILLELFYRRIEVVGRFPETGGLVIAANHHNSVVDAMLLLAVCPRRLRTLANAPLFSHPLVGPFLRVLGALPVHRRQEAGPDPARNTSLFSATSDTLHGGGAILIFPEGRTQPEPVLMELRTGAARMVQAAGDGVTLLPVGLVFHDPGTFRAGTALVMIGDPVSRADLDPAPEAAARALTERLGAALRGLIVEADDRETLRVLEVAEELWRERAGTGPIDEPARLAALREGMRRYRRARDREPARVDAFLARLAAFAAEWSEDGLVARRAYTPARVIGAAVREGLLLLVTTPLALLGVVLHGLPYRLTDLAWHAMQRTDEEEATDKIIGGMLLYPLAWTLEGWLIHAVGGAPALLAFLVALLPTGFLALAWRERLEHAARELRAWLRFLRDPTAGARLRARRQELADELAELSALADPRPPEAP